MRIATGMYPSPYQLGHSYRTVGGDVVRLVGCENATDTYQTMCCKDRVHRYTARDFGRVTGTSWEPGRADPRNLRYPPEPVIPAEEDQRRRAS